MEERSFASRALGFLLQLISFAGAKGGWNFAWKTMMTELAPQDDEGSYSRPKYDFATDPIASLPVV